MKAFSTFETFTINTMKQIFNIFLLLFIIFIDVSLSEKESVETKVKSPEDAFSWLNKYGYNPCSNSTALCSLSLSSLLKDYQERFHLKITGILDERTIQQMNRPRCGNQDKPIVALKSAVQLPRLKWSRSSLTYTIHSYPTQISKTNTRNIIREAFKAWTEYIPLNIEETCSTCKADFVIEFARERHSDSYPFDGIRGTLAHAFFPEDSRIHFDKDEAWTERFDDDKTNLFLVAVHEIGHAIGLDHTYNENSIMYPSYQPMSKSNIIRQPDRESIQSLYGKKKSSSITPSTTRLIPTTTTTKSTSTRRSLTTTRGSVTVPSGKFHPRCHLFLDAAFGHPDGTLHTFNAGILWRYLPNERTWEERATTYKQTYSGLPHLLEAGVYNSRSKEVVFFTTSYAYHYDIDNRNRAKYRNDEPLPRNLRNSIVGAIYYHNEIYVITPKTLRLLELDNGYQLSNERSLSKEFPRFTGTVTKAFSYGDLHHFFTSDHLVYIWNERLNAWQTFGKPMETNWFACSGTETYVTKNDQIKPPTTHRSSHRHRHRHHHDNY